ncbi:MAG: metal ABC transporter substrate-binding protein [Desulfovibrionaceae bacterium]|nr:metal ABC transporter substrate-binding protein [Desulfovibrionaceae bacterium]
MHPCLLAGAVLRPSGFLLLLLLAMTLLPGFSATWAQAAQPAPSAMTDRTDQPHPQARQELRVLASVFPVYLFARNVTASRPYVKVELLVPPHTGCPHGYAPTPQDLRKLAESHVLIINGLGLEAFLSSHLDRLPPHITLIDCSRGITPLPQPCGPANTPATHGHQPCEHGPANPHIFAGPRQAAGMVHTIANALARIDPQGAAAYTRAAEEYAARLYSLERRFRALGQAASRKGIVLQHDALAYLADNAGLEVTAIMQANDSQAPSAARLLELTREMLASKPVLIAAEPQFSDRLAQALARETGLPVVSLDPVATGPLDAPLSHYEAVMAANCNLLEQYFGKP